MHPKFIIAGNPLTGKGYLRMGMVINQIDKELEGYAFVFTPVYGLLGNALVLDDIEWI